jgi:Na+-driven multidrug efflux pump
MLRAQRDTTALYVTSIGYPLVMVALFGALLAYGIAGLVLARISTQWLQAIFLTGYFTYSLRRSRRAAASQETRT